MTYPRLFICRMLVLTFGVFGTVAAQEAATIEGVWKGTIDIPGSPLEIEATFTGQTILSGTIDIPAQRAKDLKLINCSIDGARVRFTIDGIPGSPTFDGTLNTAGDSIAGDFKQGGATFPFLLSRSTAAVRKAEQDSLLAALEWMRERINKALTDLNVPGAAVAVVRDGKVLMAEGFGVRNTDDRRPVDGETMFMIGSSTKAFTATLIGTLVDEGKLKWDGIVSEYLPDFRLQDDYATRHLSVEDLLSHVSGLPRHDLVWYSSSRSRGEILKTLRYLQPSAELHERWQYQNLMFMSAGLLAQQVEGRTWEELLRARIFKPLRMDSTTTSLTELTSSSNLAVGYRTRDEKGSSVVTAIPYRNIDAIGPAGSINSNAVDMAKWLLFNLGDGRVDDSIVVVQRSTLDRIHRPRVVISGRSSKETESIFNLYALGWMASAYRGELLVEHGGNIDGFSALVSFLPDRNIGVVALTNMNGSPLPTVISRTVIDKLLGAPEKDWIGPAVKQASELSAIMDERSGRGAQAIRTEGTHPSHQLEAYAGTYMNPAYGIVEVTVADKGLHLRSTTHEALTATLQHFHYDYFASVSQEEDVEGMIVEFRTGKSGGVEALLAPLEPQVDPIQFDRVAPAAMLTREGLARYEGEYELAGIVITMRVEGTTLMMVVPGQPPYRLEPRLDDEFAIADEKAYRVKFIITKGKSVAAVLVQPDGVYRAIRKEER